MPLHSLQRSPTAPLGNKGFASCSRPSRIPPKTHLESFRRHHPESPHPFLLRTILGAFLGRFCASPIFWMRKSARFLPVYAQGTLHLSPSSRKSPLDAPRIAWRILDTQRHPYAMRTILDPFLPFFWMGIPPDKKRTGVTCQTRTCFARTPRLSLRAVV